MSRLDSFIRRVSAQRACLDMACAWIGDAPGPVLEVGLGNGRTYDHLRERLPDRDIFVFERRVAAHPDCVPDDRHLILGDFRDTVPAAMARIGRPAVLAHADIGSGDAAATAEVAAFLATALPPLMAPAAILLGDQPFDPPGWRTLPPPDGVAPGRYHLYARG